ncbi:succinylglutamate desuccinylase/aspartoacylase family protein [Sediminicola sp. 1XM1-17]|uniref:succinylglutamate desuccinylase/aspartoacylase family protein n=1 Tax=Sediminicola sp. 1XM1-17 TaxID=3127702 RepID=UPI003076F74C
MNNKEERIIGHLAGSEMGPTVVFFGGIHGNEPSGCTAIQEVFQQIQSESIPITGNVYGIRGNISAQLQGMRFVVQDLNRMWTEEQISTILKKEEGDLGAEERELSEIYKLLAQILKTGTPPFYFVDFHTTSSKTLPFITINDALINRRFSSLFPVPTILGMEEYLQGPLLSYINTLGYLSLGFESGQHIEKEAVLNSIAFLWLTLVFSGALTKDAVPNFSDYYRQLQQSAENNRTFYDIVHRHNIAPKDKFEMLPGFESFEKISKGMVVAKVGHQEIRAPRSARIFMPLYQKQGEDGFFLIKSIPPMALKLSALMRGFRMDSLLTILPGITWESKKDGMLIVNVSTARFLAKPIFHLLGYRNRVLDKQRILMTNRERTAKTFMYKDTPWFKKQPHLKSLG